MNLENLSTIQLRRVAHKIGVTISSKDDRKTVLHKLLIPLKSYSMMRRGGTSSSTIVITEESEDDDDHEFQEDPSISPQVASSPWNLFVLNDGYYNYFVGITLGNSHGGAAIFRAVCGVYLNGRVYMNEKFNGCDYRMQKRSFPKVTFGSKSILRENGYRFMGSFSVKRFGENVDMLTDTIQTTDPRDYQMMKSIHSYLKTSEWMMPMEICNNEYSTRCIRKCGSIRKGCTLTYSHGRCFIYHWGTPPFTVENLGHKTFKCVETGDILPTREYYLI